MIEELPLSTGKPQRPQPIASVMPVAAVYQAFAPIEELPRPQPMASVVHQVPHTPMAAIHQVPQTPMPQTPMPLLTVKCACPACIASVDVFVVSSEAALESVDRTKMYKKIVGREDLLVVTCATIGCNRRYYYGANCVYTSGWWNTNLLHRSGQGGNRYFWCKEHE